MKFGLIPVETAQGAIAAHRLKLGATSLRKGQVLSSADVALLRAAGIAHIWAARLTPEDMPEDEAAQAIAAALESQGITARPASTGRVNLVAEAHGLVQLDAAGLTALNAVDEAITIATLPDLARVAPQTLVATIKIIPYAAPREKLTQALAGLGPDMVRLCPFKPLSAALIVTELGAQSTQKGIDAVTTRARALGLTLDQVERVPHEVAPLQSAIASSSADLLLLLGASATSDRQDVCPAALVAAGGRIERFGMPVDPGNLLFLGTRGSQHIVGLPGCAKSPALNGADWVLERLCAGLPVTSRDIAGMGVGGLLKEIATRPQPRLGRARVSARPQLRIVVLAAGTSSRMQGSDKLTRKIDGTALLRRTVLAALGAQSAAQVCVVLGGPYEAARRAALDGLAVQIINAPEADEGMAGSIRAAMSAIDADTDAVMLALADMPEIGAAHFDKLIGAFAPEQGQTLVRATAADGTPGHPVIFGRRFFEGLRGLSGDMGARAILAEGRDYLVDVALDGSAATTDLDSEDDWQSWLAARP